MRYGLAERSRVNKVLFLIALACVVFSSCARTVSFDDPYHLKAGQKKILVRLDDRLANLKEYSSAIAGSESGTYDVGKALAYLFENTSSANLNLSYVSSTLDYTFNPSSWFITPGVQSEYKLIILAESESRREIIEVSGRGGSHLNSYNAYQQAIEKAVLSLYQKLVVLFPPHGVSAASAISLRPR
jgi:hypothetical protein